MLRGLSQILVIGVWVLFSAPWAWAGNGGFPAEGGTSSLVDQGRPLYLHYCAHCHGIKGEGDGYNAEHLDKEPAELSSQKLIAKKTNEQIYRVINLGGAGVRKSHLMPVFGRTLSEEEIWSLVAYIRFLAKDSSHPVHLPFTVNISRPVISSLTPASLQAFKAWYSKNGSQSSAIDRGEGLFKKKKSCFACHMVEDEGGIVGPNLSRAGFSYTPEWIYTWIRSPQTVKRKTKMPTIGLDDQEDREITAFLANLPKERQTFPKEWMVYLDKKGDPKRGETLFFDLDGKANCAKCHWIKDKGGKVGANLSYVGSSRTLHFLLESVLDPSAVITVGFASVMILTKDGEFLTGIKKGEDSSSLRIFTKDSKYLIIPKDRIKKFKTQKISMMPENFKEILSVEEVQDILAFLATLKIPALAGNASSGDQEDVSVMKK